MKEKNTNKTDREFLDVYLGETHPQVAEPSEQAVHTENTLTSKRISAKMRRGTLEAYKQPSPVPAKPTKPQFPRRKKPGYLASCEVPPLFPFINVPLRARYSQKRPRPQRSFYRSQTLPAR